MNINPTKNEIKYIRESLNQYNSERVGDDGHTPLSECLEGIKYYCLVMSEEYIGNHFADIKKYANAIENRLDDE